MALTILDYIVVKVRYIGPTYDIDLLGHNLALSWGKEANLGRPAVHWAQVLGWLLITYALPRMEAWQTSVILVLQPAGTVLWALLILGEMFSALQWIGLVLVISGVAAAALSRLSEPLPADAL